MSAEGQRTLASWWTSYLCTGRQVVVDGERNFGLFPSDQAVGQREVNKEVLEGAKLGPPRQAQALLLRQGHGFRHPRGDRIWHVQSQLGLPGFRTENRWGFVYDFVDITGVADVGKKNTSLLQFYDSNNNTCTGVATANTLKWIGVRCSRAVTPSALLTQTSWAHYWQNILNVGLGNPSHGIINLKNCMHTLPLDQSCPNSTLIDQKPKLWTWQEIWGRVEIPSNGSKHMEIYGQLICFGWEWMKSCWESDNLFQDPHFKWSAFTPKTGGKALKIRVVAHRLQSYLPLPSFILSAIISYSFHLFVLWIPELLFSSLLLPPPDIVCCSSSALLIALPTTNPLNSEYIPHK